MDREQIIQNLKYEIEKHKNDKVDTFATNISMMCKDILDYLENEEAEDCISRQAVDKLCWEYLKVHTNDNIAFYEHFLDLPSVTPTHGTCKDCKHNKNGVCPNYRHFVDDDFYCANYEKRGDAE